MSHRGTAMIDVISPCVTFNDHQGSTKSYDYVKDHREDLQEVGFVPHFEEIHLDEEVQPGEIREVRLHDGSHLLLKRIEADYDPGDKVNAITTLERANEEGHLLTGVFYVQNGKATLLDNLNLVDEPLSRLPQARLRPPAEALAEAMHELT
jgi:2-oxoglutarate ferredoxin oxidoreductase subunit beta